MSGCPGRLGWGVVALLALAGCARNERNGAAPAEGPDTSAATAGAAVTLERAPCFGTCPVYRVTVHEDGRVEYEGERHVQVTGRATGSIDPAAFAGLVAELERAGFASLADRYAMGEPACGPYASDLPTVTLTLARGGRTKRVEHDHGCTGAPETLAALERRVDEVAGSARWVGPR